MLNLKINGLVIPNTAAHTIKQSYFPVGPQNLVRFMDGSSEMQTTYSKRGTKITGRGWVPAALNNLPYDTEMIISCILPDAKADVSNVITLPPERRTDSGFEPVGFAVVDGDVVETPIALNGDVATLTVVPSATQYEAWFYPELMMRVFRPDVSLDASSPEYDWSLTAEES